MSDDFEKQYELYEGGVQVNPGEQPELPLQKAESVASREHESTNPVDRLLIDRTGEEAVNYTGDEESERDYRPIRQSHEYRSGCLGGLMYFLFIICLSVVLAWLDGRQ